MIRPSLAVLIGIVTLLAAAETASAQKQKPDAKPPEPKVPDGKAPPKIKEPVFVDPLVKDILDAYDPEKSSPEDLLQAIKLLLDLKQPRAARPYLAKLVAAMLDDDQLTKLGRQAGSAELIRLALEKELSPDGKAFSDKVLGASRRVTRDPKRLAGLVDRLKSDADAERAAAISELRYGGEAAVNALLSALADDARSAEHANIRAALVALGGTSVDPLMGALETTSASLKAQIIDVLYRLDARDAAIYLLAPAVDPQADRAVRIAAQAVLKAWLGDVPTRAQVLATLAKHARYYFGGGSLKPADVDGNVAVWQWDAAAKQSAQRTVKSADASLTLAGRLAADWLAVDPRNAEARRILMTSLLQLAAYQNGLAKPLPAGQGAARDRAASFGVAAIEDVLAHAPEEGRAAAAAAAARILGEIGKEDLLRGTAGKPSTLVRAASSPDARVRFAALEAILKLKPSKPFAWSHTIPESLAFFAGTTGALKALVADAHAQEAQRMAGVLAELGYESEIALNTRQMIRRAMASPDMALVLFSTSLPYSDPDLVLQELRHDARTGLMPVGFLAAGNDLGRVERLTEKYPRTATFVRARNAADMKLQVDRLMETVGRDFLTLEERQQQAKQALTWLAQITAQENSLFDFKPHERALEPAMFVPALSPLGSEVLANLGTPYAQRTLVNVASTITLPIAVRQAAAAGFARTVPRHGLQLTTAEIRKQYDRYNARVDERNPENVDRPTQEVLASILDTMEALRKKPDAKASGGR